MNFSRVVDKLFSRQYLLFTNLGIGMTFHTTGDTISQTLEKWKNPNKKFNFRRLFSMTCGGMFYGLCGHTFYTYIDRRFPGNSFKIIKYKLIVDAMTCPPIALFGTAIVGTAEGKSWERICDNLNDNFLYIMAFDLFFYLPIQVINFRYINPRFRYVFVACSSLIYTTYLSYFLHRTDKKSDPSSGAHE